MRFGNQQSVFLIWIGLILSSLSSSAFSAEPKAPAPGKPVQAPASVAAPAPAPAPASAPVPTPGGAADAKEADLIPSSDPKETVPGITWGTKKVPLTVEKGESFDKVTARVTGQMRFDDWTLLYNEQVLPFEKGANAGRFSFDVPVVSSSTRVQLSAIGPKGEVQTQKLTIQSPKWTPSEAEIKKAQGEKKPRVEAFSAGLGFTSINYQETGAKDFSELALVMKFTYATTLFSPQWDFAANLFIDPFAISSSRSDISVKFIGANLRFGYVLPFVEEPWRVSLLTGVSYATMSVTGDAFGYKALIYPQIYPSVRRRLKTNDAIFGYLKYVPLSGSFFSDREFALGFGWAHPLEKGKSVILGVDFSDLGFKLLDSRNREKAIRSGALGFSVSYGF